MANAQAIAAEITAALQPMITAATAATVAPASPVTVGPAVATIPSLAPQHKPMQIGLTMSYQERPKPI
jgi:hypothetical protein